MRSIAIRLLMLAVTPAALPLISFAQALQAQSPAGIGEPSEPLTLAQALALTEQHNPRLQAALASVQAAGAGVVTARAYLNPDITGGVGRQRATKDSNIPGPLQVYSFSQPLELPSVRRARIDTASRGRASSEFALADARVVVRAAVKQAFYEALRRKGEVELAQANLKLIEELQRRIQVQVQVGEAARLELIRADAEVATARISVRSIELRYATALSALYAAVGARLSGSREPQDQLDPPQVLPALDELRADVLARHPVMALARSEIQRAEARLGLERALRKPQPTLRADLEQQPDAALYRFAVTVPIPLWNRRQGPIGEAEAALREASAMAEIHRIEIGAALERAYGQYQVANQQLAAFEAGTLKEAEAALSAAEAAFRFGERGIIEVLDAQRVLRGARFDYLSAQFDRQSAWIELEQLRAIDLGSNTP